VVKGLLTARSKQRKAQKLESESRAALDDLDADKKDFAVDIWKALGGYADLPLGAAAVKREEGEVDPIAAAATKAWDAADPATKKEPETTH